MSGVYTDLPWLPVPPADFRARARQLAAGQADLGRQIQTLASYRLSAAQSISLGRAIAAAREAGANFAPLTAFRLAVLSNTTTDLIADALPAAAARHGVALELVLPDYDQVMQEALDPSSHVNSAKPDAVLLAVDYRWLKLDRPSLDGTADQVVDRAIERIEAVMTGIKQGCGAPLMLQTVPQPPSGLFGSYDRLTQGTVRSLIEAVNHRIAKLAKEGGNFLVDIAALAERIGTDNWFDPVRFFAYKLPFSPDCDLVYADVIGRVLGAIRGKARKCLVLDLDNTVWGGVIGDDGMEGIKIGQGSPVGEAFLAIQTLALDLKARGIMLAVSSKNTDAVAREPFRSHPDMLLRESDISVFQANWLDKPSNLESIARTLNIGIDALVFLDDNGAERAQVRAALPMVAVPELPEDPSAYPWHLMAAGYFEAVSFSAEDSLRAASYASDALRAEVMQKSRDLGDYLSSLDMVITYASFTPNGRQRIAQLINKSNQFNLTTRRYSEPDVKALEDVPDVFTLQVRLEDKFGDLGMIGVIIARPTNEGGIPTWEIDTWLMSCRVLGRKVEEAMLSKLVNTARDAGISRIIGVYIPTSKNSMVKEHYKKLGFDFLDGDQDATARYELQVSEFETPVIPMKVKDLTPEVASAA
jgi:FkbH-like protein